MKYTDEELLDQFNTGTNLLLYFFKNNEKANEITLQTWIAIFQIISAKFAKDVGFTLEEYQSRLGHTASRVKSIFKEEE